MCCCSATPCRAPSSSTTAQLVPTALRFWVPGHEMEMCGHATVGAVWLLDRLGRLPAEDVLIWTPSGPVAAQVRTVDGERFVEISQPAGRVTSLAEHARARLLDVLRLTAADLTDDVEVQNAATSRVKTLVPLRSVELLDALQPDFPRVEELCRVLGSTGIYPYAAQSTPTEPSTRGSSRLVGLPRGRGHRHRRRRPGVRTAGRAQGRAHRRADPGTSGPRHGTTVADPGPLRTRGREARGLLDRWARPSGRFSLEIFASPDRRMDRKTWCTRGFRRSTVAGMTSEEFLPVDFDPPTSLVTDDFRLEPLGPQHNEADHAAWMSSIEHIRSTPSYPDGRWPPLRGMTLEENLSDLRRHADDFTRGVGFTFTVLDPSTTTSSAVSTSIPRPPPSGTSRCSPGCELTVRASTYLSPTQSPTGSPPTGPGSVSTATAAERRRPPTPETQLRRRSRPTADRSRSGAPCPRSARRRSPRPRLARPEGSRTAATPRRCTRPRAPGPLASAGRARAAPRRRCRPRPRTGPAARVRRTPTSSSAARVAPAYARASPPVPSSVPPNQRETTATTSVSSRPRSSSSIGAPAVPGGSPPSFEPSMARSGPTTKAVQWWRASQFCLRTCSRTARAPSSSFTRARVQRKRERLSSISATPSRPIVRYDVTDTRRHPSCWLWHDQCMRIVSLLPSTTEILFAIGAGDDVVGVTFECDYPARRASDGSSRRVRCPRGSTPRRSTLHVSAALRAGEDLYHLDEGALAGLDADLVVTQDLCAVCAVDVSVVDDALAHLGCTAEVLTVDPHTLDEVLDLDHHARCGHRPLRGGASAWWPPSSTAGRGAGPRWRPERPGRARACCCSSGPTRPSRPATGCRRWSRPPAACPTIGAAGEKSVRVTWEQALADEPGRRRLRAVRLRPRGLGRAGAGAGGLRGAARPGPGVGGGRQRVLRAPRATAGRRRREPGADLRPDRAGARSGDAPGGCAERARPRAGRVEWWGDLGRVTPPLGIRGDGTGGTRLREHSMCPGTTASDPQAGTTGSMCSLKSRQSAAERRDISDKFDSDISDDSRRGPRSPAGPAG